MAGSVFCKEQLTLTASKHSLLFPLLKHLMIAEVVGRKKAEAMNAHQKISHVVTRKRHPPTIRHPHPHTNTRCLRVATRPSSHDLAQTTFPIVSCRCRSLCPPTHIIIIYNIHNIPAILYQTTCLVHHTTLCVITTQLIRLYLSLVVGCHYDFDVKKILVGNMITLRWFG